MADNQEKKIIVDEDWKSQVAAEKEAAAQRQQEAPSAAGAPQPAASLEMLISLLTSEAMVALGQIPRPDTGRPQTDLNQAKLFIDLLSVLEEKTRGNLTPQETAALAGLLSDLRMAYVAVRNQSGQAAAAASPSEPPKPNIIH